MGYTQDLIAHWDLSTDNPPDICWRGNRYPGTGANIVGHPNGIAGGHCTEFNGNNSNINVGDVVELNSVEKFTIALWMNQDVLSAVDYILTKHLDGTHGILITTGANSLSFFIRNGFNSFGSFDYTLVVSARSWHHLACVFDGSQTGYANRMQVYVDGEPITLAFTGAIPAMTADLAGTNVVVGNLLTTSGFDGKLDEFMILSAALTGIQVADLYNRTRQNRM